MKSLFAVMSDVFPVCGYKKRWYMTLSALAGSASVICLAFMPLERLAGNEKTGTRAMVFFFFANLQLALSDCLTQGKYTQVAKEKGSAIVTFVWGNMHAWITASSLVVGYLNDIDPQITIACAIPLAMQAAVVASLNFVGDEKVDPPCKADTTVLGTHPRIIALGVVMGVVALITNFTGVIVESLFDIRVDDAADVQLLFTLAASVGLLGMSFWALPFIVAKINVYLWLCRAMTLGLSSTTYRYFTVQPHICEHTPHFPNILYQTVGNITSGAASLLGVYLFEKYLVHWKAQRAFWVTTAFTCIAASCDIMLVTRFNRDLLGWTGLGRTMSVPLPALNEETRHMYESVNTRHADRPGFTPIDVDATHADVRLDDMVSFILGTQALVSVVGVLDSLPSTLLLSKMCPKNVESTVFAILACFSNLGLQMSTYLGSKFVRHMGIEILDYSIQDSELFDKKCQIGDAGDGGMNGVAWALLIGNIVMPLLTIPLTWCFIPNIRLDEDLLNEEQQDIREVELSTQGNFGEVFSIREEPSSAGTGAAGSAGAGATVAASGAAGTGAAGAGSALPKSALGGGLSKREKERVVRFKSRVSITSDGSHTKYTLL